MTERQIGSTYCMHYDTEAKFFLEDEHPSGLHHRVVHYVNGGHDGRPAFAAAIPHDWTEQDVSNLLLQPMKDDPKQQQISCLGNSLSCLWQPAAVSMVGW